MKEASRIGLGRNRKLHHLLWIAVLWIDDGYLIFQRNHSGWKSRYFWWLMCMDYLDQIRPWGGSANRITHPIPCHPIKHASLALSQLTFDADFVNIANFLWRSPKHDQVSCDNIICDVFSLRPWDTYWTVSRLYSDGRIQLGKGQYCVLLSSSNSTPNSMSTPCS